MPKNKKKFYIFKFFKVYGFNAVLGFTLGVIIVLVSLSFLNPSYFGNKLSNTPSNAVTNEQSSAISRINQGDEAVKEDQVDKSLLSQGGAINNSRFTVLLIGMDNRPGENYVGNTDSLLVTSIDTVNHRISFLSVPRDTQVNLPGSGIQKINAIARLQKGFPSTQKYIEQLIGSPIDGYVMTNFNGFKTIVDTLGGITVNIEKNMHYDTGDSQDRYIDLKKGTQRLNGTQALQYARFRNDELADISRTARQQEILKAIFAEATALKNLPKIPLVISKVYQNVQTDLNIGQLWSLANTFNKKDTFQTINQTLPGKFVTEQGVSYWKVNSSLAKKVVSQLYLEGKTTSAFTQDTSESVQMTVSPTPNQSEKTKPAENKEENNRKNEIPSNKQSVKKDQNKQEKLKQENKENSESGIQFEVIK